MNDNKNIKNQNWGLHLVFHTQKRSLDLRERDPWGTWTVKARSFGVYPGVPSAFQMAFTPLRKVAVAVLFFFWLLYPLQWRYPSVLDKWPSTAVLLSDDVELMQKSFTNWHSPRHAFVKANSGTWINWLKESMHKAWFCLTHLLNFVEVVSVNPPFSDACPLQKCDMAMCFPLAGSLPDKHWGRRYLEDVFGKQLDRIVSSFKKAQLTGDCLDTPLTFGSDKCGWNGATFSSMYWHCCIMLHCFLSRRVFHCTELSSIVSWHVILAAWQVHIFAPVRDAFKPQLPLMPCPVEVLSLNSPEPPSKQPRLDTACTWKRTTCIIIISICIIILYQWAVNLWRHPMMSLFFRGPGARSCGAWTGLASSLAELLWMCNWMD